MDHNCVGCFADVSDYKSGCKALSSRISPNCPFYKTREQFDDDQRRCKGILRVNRPHLYNHYYGKDDRNGSDRTTQEGY